MWKASAVLFYSFEPAMVRCEKEEAGHCNYGKAMLKLPISSSNEVGFFAVVAVRSEDRRRYEPGLFIRPRGPGEKEAVRVSLESLSRPAGSQVTTGDAASAVLW